MHMLGLLQSPRQLCPDPTTPVLRLQKILSKAVQLPHPTSIPDTNRRSNPENRRLGRPQLHARDSTILRSLLTTDASVSLPE